jgi:hypothetical protein
MTTFVSADGFLEEMLGDIDVVDQGELYPFGVRVGVVKYRPPRHECFEYMLNMGYTDIEKVLEHRGVLSGYLTFVFPERHMGIHEQRKFMYEMCKHPTVDKINRVDIITSCPLMISDFMAQMIRIITWPGDAEKYGSER